MGVGQERVDWISLVQFRDQFRAVVNTVMNLRVRNNAGIFLAGRGTVICLSIYLSIFSLSLYLYLSNTSAVDYNNIQSAAVQL